MKNSCCLQRHTGQWHSYQTIPLLKSLIFIMGTGRIVFISMCKLNSEACCHRDQAVRVRSMTGDIALCSYARHFVLKGASLHPGVWIDTSQVLGQPDKNAEGNLLWTRKTSSCANRDRTLVKKQTTIHRKINTQIKLNYVYRRISFSKIHIFSF